MSSQRNEPLWISKCCAAEFSWQSSETKGTVISELPVADLNDPACWLLGETELGLPQHMRSPRSALTFLLRLFTQELGQHCGEMLGRAEGQGKMCIP